jgi:hypothetical protein
MRLSALNRLRLAFCGIGALLLVPLGLLAHSVNERLEAQRRLRHEVVAERIFDELERELTVVLSQEFARPSSAYDAASMDAAGVAPYVLGYFTKVDGRTNLLGGQKPDEEREQRTRWALEQWERRGREGTSAPAPAVPAPTKETAPSAPEKGNGPASPASPVQPAPRSSPEILRKLNRSEKERSDFGY